MEQQFDVAIVGLRINNGQYVADMRTDVSEPDAVLFIRSSKEFTMTHTLKIVKEINSYLPNLSTGEFKIKFDGIKFNCICERR